MHSRTDFVLPGPLPIVFRRTYRTGDTTSRPFGIGATHNYVMFIRETSGGAYTEGQLILPDGGRIRFVRTSPGTGFAGVEFEHTESQTRWYKATLKVVGIESRSRLTSLPPRERNFTAHRADAT